MQRTGGLTRKATERWAIFLFLLPFLASFLMFFVFPACYSLTLSFYRVNGYSKMTYLGIANYKNLLNYRTMWQCLRNTFQYAMTSFVCVLVISFLLAVMLKSKKVARYQRIYKPIVFLPQWHVITLPAVV